MLFEGSWMLAPDRVLRPIVKAYLFSSEGNPCEIPLMLDTGADRTVLSASALAEIGFQDVGRDLLNNFAVILDRKKELVALLAPNHTYSIQELN
jgi:hypothetical protein